MMNILRCLLLISLCLMGRVSHADSIESLMANNELSVELTLRTQGELIVQQPIVFAIDVSTKNWFAKGTHLQLPQFDNLIMLPDGEISINSNKQVDGVTWASQIREITLYPTKAGKFVLPAITVHISVKTEQGTAEGTVVTEPMAFEVTLVPALKDIEHYIVSDHVELQQTWSDPDKPDFLVGDALTHTLFFSAQGVPAMMLPELPAYEQTGLSVYRKPPELIDKSNRGTRTGKRTDEFHYIFEQPGLYSFAEQRFYWWHPSEQRLIELTIPAKEVTVKGATGLERLTHQSGTVVNRLSKVPIYWLLMAVIGAGLLLTLLRHRSQLVTVYHRVRQTALRELQAAYLSAINEKKYLSALQLLYEIHQIPLHDRYALTALFQENTQQRAVLKQLQLLACAASVQGQTIIRLVDAQLLLVAPTTQDSKKPIVLFKLNP